MSLTHIRPQVLWHVFSVLHPVAVTSLLPRWVGLLPPVFLPLIIFFSSSHVVLAHSFVASEFIVPLPLTSVFAVPLISSVTINLIAPLVTLLARLSPRHVLGHGDLAAAPSLCLRMVKWVLSNLSLVVKTIPSDRGPDTYTTTDDTRAVLGVASSYCGFNFYCVVINSAGYAVESCSSSSIGAVAHSRTSISSSSTAWPMCGRTATVDRTAIRSSCVPSPGMFWYGCIRGWGSCYGASPVPYHIDIPVGSSATITGFRKITTLIQHLVVAPSGLPLGCRSYSQLLLRYRTGYDHDDLIISLTLIIVVTTMFTVTLLTAVLALGMTLAVVAPTITQFIYSSFGHQST